MTPGARLQAAAEILETLTRESRGTDRVLRDYFRQRRYAGSKDRRAVNDRVYGVLRRRGRLLWRLELAGAIDPDPRLLLLADLILQDGIDVAEIEGLFDGRGYAPKPPTSAERAAVTALTARPADPEPVPSWVAGNVPLWLEAPLRARFGADLDRELAALNVLAPVDLRVNGPRVNGPRVNGPRVNGLRVNGLRAGTPSAAAREIVRAGLAAAGIEAVPTPHASLGLRLAAPSDLSRTEAWRAGEIEIQDEGSQLVARLVDARPGMTVVDYCAGAGGKSLGLAADMAGQGRLVACDSDPKRLARLAPRARRAGAEFIEARPLAGAASLVELTGKTDRVLLDVPCSGMGAWRRDPAARWRLRPEDIDRFAAVQAEILAVAAPLVRPGGRLIYATCAFLAAENEDQIARFLDAHSDFHLRSAGATAREVGLTDEVCSADGSFLSVTPGRQGCDGFFAAILERAGLERAGIGGAAAESAFSEA